MFPGEGVSGYPFPHGYLSQPHRAREKVLSGKGKGLRETDHVITSRNTEEKNYSIEFTRFKCLHDFLMNKIYTHQRNCVCLLTYSTFGSNCVDALCFIHVEIVNISIHFICVACLRLEMRCIPNDVLQTIFLDYALCNLASSV